MSRAIVCLSFDFDALSGWIARGMTTPTPISRGEFGAVGAERLLTLLHKYQLPSTWFIPGITIGTYPDVCAKIAVHGHEIGHHGWTHVAPAKLSAAEEEQGLIRGNEAIQALCGQPAKGYRSPSWDLSDNTIALLLKHNFSYDSSMMGHDYLPYQARSGDIINADEAVQFGQPTELVEMPISWTLDDYPHFEFVVNRSGVFPGLMNANDVLQNWLDDYHYLQHNLDWGIITYTFHPFVIGRGHRLLMLEKLLLQLIENGAIFMTMSDAVDEFQTLDAQP